MAQVTSVQPLIVSTAVQRWKAYLLTPVDGASVAAFRILFGTLMGWEVARYFAHGWIERYYLAPKFHFTYPFLDFLRPWPGDGMYLHFAVMGLLALLIALGLLYRLSAALFFLAFTYVFLLDKAYYLNHSYLIILLSFLLCLIPAHRAASLDRWLFWKTQPAVVPQWSVLLLRAQVFVVYFYAGLAKLNGDWLQGEPMRMWLAERSDFPYVGHFFTEEWMVFLFAYGGLLFDLGIGFLLSWKRTRLPAIALAGLFHLINSQLFSIGIFPPLAFSATLIFAEPDWPRRVLGVVGRSSAWLQASTQRMAGPLAGVPTASPPSGSAMLVFIHLYLLAQLLIPLRHMLYRGNVSWTEEGHRFAWHMKLRTKDTILRIYVTDARTGETWEVSPAADLSARQLDEMQTRPDMVLQYAHYLADRWTAGSQPRPIIRVDQQVSLNGRSPQALIDPTVNLAEVPFSLGPASWLLPLTVPLRSRSDAVSAGR